MARWQRVPAHSGPGAGRNRWGRGWLGTGIPWLGALNRARNRGGADREIAAGLLVLDPGAPSPQSALVVQGAIDAALWNITGKLWGQPIHQLLGDALCERVPACTTGGYTRAQEMIGMTSLHRVIYGPSCWSTHLHMAATLHLLAALPSPLMRLLDDPPLLEFDTSDSPLRDDTILAEPIVLNADGTVSVPTSPGPGVEIDEDKVAHFVEEAKGEQASAHRVPLAGRAR